MLKSISEQKRNKPAGNTLLHPIFENIAAARVHEATGDGRYTFALALAAKMSGKILWVQSHASTDNLYAPGLAQFFDPARLILATPTSQRQVLPVVEEALRSDALQLVIADLREAPDLTASRRLQLAAGTGGGRGVCLIPEHRLCTNAAETRWHCTPRNSVDSRAQNWRIIKNKRGQLGQWQVHWEHTEFVISPKKPASQSQTQHSGK